MGKRTVLALSVAMCLVISGLFLSACSSQRETPSGSSTSSSTVASSASSASSSASTSSASSAASNAQTSSSSEAAAQRQEELERLASLEESYEQTIATKDDWADGVVVDSLNKLVEQGAIAPLPEDFQLFNNTFQFERAGDGYDIVFLDEAAKSQLTGDFALDLSDGSKVALCTPLHMLNEDGSRARDVTVPYVDKDGAFSPNASGLKKTQLDYPTLVPTGAMGTYDALQSSVPLDTFADTTDECRYLIAYGDCYSHIEENYYSATPMGEGTIDRIDTTTVVLVIDAQERQVLHIENIGTSIPSDAKNAATLDNYGKELTKEALDYIIGLLPHN